MTSFRIRDRNWPVVRRAAVGEHLVDDLPGDGLGHRCGLVDDHPGLGEVDAAGVQSVPHPGESLRQVAGERQVLFGGVPGPRERGTYLVRLELPRLRAAVRQAPRRNGGVGDRSHRGVELGLVVCDLPGVSLEQGHEVVSGQPGAVDLGQCGGQLRPRLQILQVAELPETLWDVIQHASNVSRPCDTFHIERQRRAM
jgi:hypothetical protein